LFDPEISRGGAGQKPLGCFIGLFFIAGTVIPALVRVFRLKKQFERITITKDILRVEALKQGKRTTTEIPVSELEDLVAPTRRGVMNTTEVPGMKKVSLGDTGIPRMSDGRPMPPFILSLIKAHPVPASFSTKRIN
jgi:hypothetical protein